MRFLPFVSLALFLITSCSPKVALIGNQNSETIFWQPQLRDSVLINKYRMAMSRDKVNISGIWIVKLMEDSWRGALINEFGLKLFDFSCNADDCQLINVVKMMDKWYIKKTIAGDIQFLLEIDNPKFKPGKYAERRIRNDILSISYKKEKMLLQYTTGEIIMYNRKHKLKYSFKKIEE